MNKKPPANQKSPSGEDEDLEEEVTQSLTEEHLEKEEAETDLKEGDRVKELEGKLKEMEDRYLRASADFDNYRKRSSKEREEAAMHASEKLLRELLEVKDHLELALSYSKESSETKGLREGVSLTLKQLSKFLEKFGVEEIKAVGEPFNPALHEAIQQEESVEYKPGSVVQVYQKGYLFHKRLLRAAKVTVAANKES